MTSVERNDSNVYGDALKPKYSILTYTWGRWQVKTDNPPPTLPVKGTTWKIPAVKEEHFTVEAFQKIVNRMGDDGVEWAWIDIACIDQVKKPVKMDEIGRQASIFHNAHKVFVWLSHIATDTLSAAIADIDEYGPELWFRHTKTTLTVPELVDRLHGAFNIIFNDPWFSSLWTLQEVILRNDALVLSAEGDPIPLKPDGRLFLTIFINTCQNVYKDLETLVLEVDEERTLNQVRAIMDKILQAGFYFLFTDNPNVQYGIARYRQTKHDEDRVYAIMQVYNLRVGQSIRPTDNPSLHQLFDEFSLAINSLCPILGQSFVHTTRPDYKKCWRITQTSRVPDTLMIYKDPNAQSRIGMNTSLCVVATGNCCPFPDLLQFVQYWEDPVDTHIIFRLILDDYVRGRAYGSTISRSSNEAAWLPYARILYDEFGKENLCVFLLGDVRAEWSRSFGDFERRHVGLLLRQVEGSLEGDTQNVAFERLGVCTWVPRSKELRNLVDGLAWKEVDLELR